MSPTYHIPPCFHPGWSLLGYTLRRATGDRRRAEAFHLVILTGLALLLLLAHYLVWALAADSLSALARWSAEGGALAFVLMTCVWGRKPGATITCAANELHVEQGRRTMTLAYDEIEAVEVISSLRFHRHERRYTATRAFFDRLDENLLLLKTARGPVVVGLAPEDHAAFHAFLKRQHPAEAIQPVSET